MFQVVKRDGELDEFKMGKITAAINKAFDAKGKNYSSDMIDLLGLRVTADFQNKIENNRISVEDIQDSVENVLDPKRDRSAIRDRAVPKCGSGDVSYPADGHIF